MSTTNDRVESLLASGRAVEAVAILEPEARLKPGSFEVWHCLGRAYGQAGRLADAEKAFGAAVRLRPDLHDAHYNLALTLAYQDKLAEAAAHFAQARKIDPRNPEFQKTLFPILVTLLQRSGEAGPPLAAKLGPLAARPLVSVVVPTLNRPRMLRDALESVARQGYEKWEAIVANDGGGDVSPVVEALPGTARAKIRQIRLPETRGPAAARNAAIAVAQGDVLAFLDDDDFHAPTHLEGLVAGLRASGAGMAYAAAELVQETLKDGKRLETARRPFLPGLRYSRPLLLVRNYIPINTWGVRREGFAVAGAFDEALHYLEDWDFLLRLSARFDVHQMTEVTAEYRVTPETGDSVTKRHQHSQAVHSFYRRHDASGLPWVGLARELYLESLGA